MLVEVVTEALAAVPLQDQDAAAASLALTYAQRIDEREDLAKLGPALLAALEALHMTPRARAAVKKVVSDDKPGSNPLDELASRRAGLGNPQGMDATAS